MIGKPFKLFVVAIIVVPFVAGCQKPSLEADVSPTRISLAADSNHAEVSAPVATTDDELTVKALETAKASQRFLFVYIWKNDDEPTQSRRSVFQEFAAEVRGQADTAELCIASASDKDFIIKYDLSRAPMPLVLAFAPNGAIAGAFPQQFTKDDLRSGFISPQTANCMKLLQEGKLVVLCVQNANTNTNDASLQGVNEFRSDARYQSAVEVVRLDPGDQSEAAFLRDLQVSPNTAVAVTVLLAPPGSPIAKFEGATTKDAFVQALSKKASECCPGGQCGPDGCGPQ
jgi:hypothetical protein